jgi:ATP-binding cassette subfamily G (WHITE) protein 2
MSGNLTTLAVNTTDLAENITALEEDFDYVFQIDATSIVAMALLLLFFVLVPFALWLSVLQPLCAVGGLEGWISQGGRDPSADPRLKKRGTPTPPRSALLSFANVHYTVKLPGREAPLHVLKGVSGVLRPGTLTAIMGPSGCGKSTMLDVLASTKNVGLIQGDVRLNGRPRDGHFRSLCAYVMQEDCCHKTLTVRETLFFTAALRLGPHVSREERLARIRDTMADVDLTHVADTKIGDDVSGGLSGGQRRRVTIAIELISQPTLVLLDEPTSGLDAYGAQQVVSSLRRSADRGRTLACTIHQPRAETFALFHQLLLMKAGETMYCGPVSGIPVHLGTCGVPCPPGVNPADIVVDLTHTKEKGDDEQTGAHTVSADELVVLFSKSELRRSIVKQLRDINEGTDPDLPEDSRRGAARSVDDDGGSGYPNSLWTQVGVLVRRQFTIDMRDFGYKFTWFFNGEREWGTGG